MAGLTHSLCLPYFCGEVVIALQNNHYTGAINVLMQGRKELTENVQYRSLRAVREISSALNMLTVMEPLLLFSAIKYYVVLKTRDRIRGEYKNYTKVYSISCVMSIKYLICLLQWLCICKRFSCGCFSVFLLVLL